jgi:hypothetical protein
MESLDAPRPSRSSFAVGVLVALFTLALAACGQPGSKPGDALDEAGAAEPGSASASVAPDDEGFVELFNGRDLEGWDANPELWKVEDGVIVGTCEGPEKPEFNEFLIWEGGTLADFELRVVARLHGDNNSGVQYRSRRYPETGPWGISGYQNDIHPATQHNGMTYEERGRGIFGLNGQEVALDPEGKLWLLSEHEPVEADISEWTEYGVVARGNRLVHTINGQVSSTLVDYHEAGRALQGLLAIQLHRGQAHVLEVRSIRYKPLEQTAPEPFAEGSLPESATPIERSGPGGKGKGKAKAKSDAAGKGEAQ